MPSTDPDHLEKSAALWQQLGHAFCITLNGRDDRKDHALHEFKRVGLGDHIQFHHAERHPQNSEQGIYESHLACLQKGLALTTTAANASDSTNSKPIIVFEDDIFFQRFSAEHLAQAAAFVQGKHDWDVLFLGGFVKASHATRWRGIRKIRYQCTAHAYVISPAFAQQMLSEPWQGKAYDDVLRDHALGRYFALYPAIGYQSDSPSDNRQTPIIDRVRRLLGGMARLQRMNELVHRHMTLLVMGHVVVLAALIVLAMWMKW